MTYFRPDEPARSTTSTSSQTPSPGPALDPMAILVAAMAGALVMLALVLVVIGAELVVPEAWILITVAVATVAAWAMVILVPVARRGTSEEAVVSSTVILRTAVLEAPAILGLSLAFVSSPMSLLPYLLPAVFSLAGLWLFARPSVVRARVASSRR